MTHAVIGQALTGGMMNPAGSLAAYIKGPGSKVTGAGAYNETKLNLNSAAKGSKKPTARVMG